MATWTNESGSWNTLLPPLSTFLYEVHLQFSIACSIWSLPKLRLPSLYWMAVMAVWVMGVWWRQAACCYLATRTSWLINIITASYSRSRIAYRPDGLPCPPHGSTDDNDFTMKWKRPAKSTNGISGHCHAQVNPLLVLNCHHYKKSVSWICFVYFICNFEYVGSTGNLTRLFMVKRHISEEVLWIALSWNSIKQPYL